MPASGRWPVATDEEDFAEHLAGAELTAIRMFWRFIELARACGPTTFELQRSLIVLRGGKRSSRRSGSGRPVCMGTSSWRASCLLAGESARPKGLTKKLYFHSYVISSIDDLDAEFGQLLCEGRHVGDGKPLQPDALVSWLATASCPD